MELDEVEKILSSCKLCPRNCCVDRNNGQLGFCNAGLYVKVARVGLHQWEEPPISGERGSGTIFFSNCNLKCCFCQNYQISHEGYGKELSIPELAQKFIYLQSNGAHNINLVTGSPYVPQIVQAIKIARAIGLAVPVVYNTSSYEKVETLKLLDGVVDIYLPDIKFVSPELSRKYLGVANYFAVASPAILEMVRQRGPAVMDENGLMRSGVIVRHLVMPGMTDDTLRCMEWFKDNLSKSGVYFSLMAQYLPFYEAKQHPEINRQLNEEEYNTVVNKLEELELEDGFMQDLSSASEEYVPAFDLTGVENLIR